ncbi:hypothetical protein DICVIV_06185 [Dictyocaulus viviparus]|uniref:Uncharacterized protein n=1 Tax=Dictyocaulus viviparus TaxID=29172 RepID=A0A0D8XSY7_DICVI|nr:hypothetical protein DICVIV_06185 [Dictyocaulus viviparus]
MQLLLNDVIDRTKKNFLKFDKFSAPPHSLQLSVPDKLYLADTGSSNEHTKPTSRTKKRRTVPHQLNSRNEWLLFGDETLFIKYDRIPLT